MSHCVRVHVAAVEVATTAGTVRGRSDLPNDRPSDGTAASCARVRKCEIRCMSVRPSVRPSASASVLPFFAIAAALLFRKETRSIWGRTEREKERAGGRAEGKGIQDPTDLLCNSRARAQTFNRAIAP